jgi:hypothetical protein
VSEARSFANVEPRKGAKPRRRPRQSMIRQSSQASPRDATTASVHLGEGVVGCAVPALAHDVVLSAGEIGESALQALSPRAHAGKARHGASEVSYYLAVNKSLYRDSFIRSTAGWVIS